MPASKRERALQAIATGKASRSPRPYRRQTDQRDTPVLGSLAFCWCGDVARHDWPGKANGTPHPTATERTTRT